MLMSRKDITIRPNNPLYDDYFDCLGFGTSIERFW